MSTIKQFQAVATNIFKQAVKVYNLQSLTRHRDISTKNLYEKLSQYPGGGVHFRIRRKTWPAKMYAIVTEANYKTSRSGNLYGKIYNDKDRKESSVPLRLRNGSKRSVWQYQVPEEGEIVLDNGMKFTLKEINQAWNNKRQIQQKQEQQSLETQNETKQ